MRAHELFEKLASENAPDVFQVPVDAAGEVKLSGFGQALKQLALTDIGGPKGFLQPISRAVEHGKGGVGKVIRPGGAAKPVRTARAAGGAWDVSQQARQMGIG